MAALKRVVITGMGAVSSIGTGLQAIEESLRVGRSGIVSVPAWKELGIASHIAGLPETEPPSPLVTRKIEKSASSCALMALRATDEALSTAALLPSDVRGTNIAVLIGSGTGSSLRNFTSAEALQRARSTRRVHPFTVPHVMGSTAAANVSVALGTLGESWSVSSACSTGSHAIGIGSLYVRSGRYERVLAGASEEIDWIHAGPFDAMHALSRGFVENPTLASRPFDRDRDGFVISGGAGVVLLEELELALNRGATIYAEIVGWGSNSDGYDMVAPMPEGAADAIRRALRDAELAPEQIAYVNAHGTSTPQGDLSEAAAMKTVFGTRQPLVSSTKSSTGHAIGAAGSLEVVYSVMMMRGDFVAPNLNVHTLDQGAEHLNLATQPGRAHEIPFALSNSFGFGGTNSCLVLKRWEGYSV